MKTTKVTLLASLFACAAALGGDAYSSVSACPGSGTYEIGQAGTDFVLSGNIAGDVSVTLPDSCRVTLSDVTMSGVLTIDCAQPCLRASYGRSDPSATRSSSDFHNRCFTAGGRFSLY